MEFLFEEVNQIYHSLKSYQNSEILLCFYVTALSDSYIYNLVTSSLTWTGFFFQNCFYFKLLIIMFIRMFGIQY